MSPAPRGVGQAGENRGLIVGPHHRPQTGGVPSRAEEPRERGPRDPGADLTPVVVGYGKALEVQTNALLRLAMAGAPNQKALLRMMPMLTASEISM